MKVLTFTEYTVVPTRSSNDLNVFEFLTSPNLFLNDSPRPPNTEMVRSPAPLTNSDVF